MSDIYIMVLEDLEAAIKIYIKELYNRDLAEKEKDVLLDNLSIELSNIEEFAINLYVKIQLLKKYGFTESYDYMNEILKQYLYY